MSDDPPATADAARWQEQHERARAEVRGRYLEHLAAVFTEHGISDPDQLARVAIGALFDWRDADTGDPCMCGCHPRLGSHDVHDSGFDCPCAKTADQRRRDRSQWWAGIAEFWESPEGRLLQEREAAQEVDLQVWLETQPDVVVSSHGGLCPEQWEGVVDGHRFYFRERTGDWHLELERCTGGSSGWAVPGVVVEGRGEMEKIAHRCWDIIAEGATGADGDGDNPVQRAQFIVDTIRTHLARQTCTHGGPDTGAFGDVLGDQPRWCPSCGARLNGATTP
ncbi:MAG TPA: hypothetical protein PKL10_02520 [Nitrospira sp.]|nr:hypothetical protein [Mycobacterium sp.]TXH14987.1 MAG: hypothetical protein E6R00_08210 [Gammaproteobacteria bacterium]HNK15511.1 hypothetical protein [Nitrospira sp.]HNO87790.1 hypothetical protein [Rhodocyclaceae bacterium]MCB0943816.1 hypothetical protein [Mycobacterium sp.]